MNRNDDGEKRQQQNYFSQLSIILTLQRERYL